MRIGFGFDVHQLVEGRDFWLGGVKIPAKKGILGHSDADVLLHAISDAILGALALGDIGMHFPDTSAENKGIDSKLILAKCVSLIKEKGYKIGNIDSTVVCESPKIMPHATAMREQIAQVCEITFEDFIGRKEGIVAHAVVLLVKI
jgi:2-C-methyl-D-erythritol 2,4-cyclodiphosphate synthase